MSLICSAVINSTTRRIASEYLSSLSQSYLGEIADVSNFVLSCSKPNGGYLRPTYGNMSILQSAFVGNWPPPVVLTLPVKFVKSDLTLVDIASAAGQITEINATRANYDLYGPVLNHVTTPATFSGTLFNYFTTACGPSLLNLTLNTSKATDYNLSFTTTSDRQLIDLLDNIASDVNHGFYIDGTTLYLIDLAKDNSSYTLTEFDFIEAGYSGPVPYSIFKHSTFTVTGTYPNGTENSQSYIFHTVEADVKAQLTRLKTISDKWTLSLTLPLGDVFFKYGDKISWLDESKFGPINAVMNVREIGYSITDKKEVVSLKGEGTVS